MVFQGVTQGGQVVAGRGSSTAPVALCQAGAECSGGMNIMGSEAQAGADTDFV
eukprot:CAMPEP_0174367274 /NCGR_PEP_ID=MMETSP0811_2-20130205/84619_1 /TAXON_ID=73025 ORGANISM="Eutreptiella gymnastica-like, Strain CCMP1594" /NCGR_SAMPLE_ID=MMETSP0811_2 /ASSEMBLY_ACC=CAM_ASM_000667 /LENGTH=52 /DNA_ID=CAMNT_0015509681 /DNA_START=41 /DNA_END=199 /DNA_ORIENTATION=-